VAPQALSGLRHTNAGANLLAANPKSFSSSIVENVSGRDFGVGFAPGHNAATLPSTFPEESPALSMLGRMCGECVER